MNRIIKYILLVMPISFTVQSHLVENDYWVKLILGTLLTIAYIKVIDLLDEKAKPPTEIDQLSK
jgi:hypothetical protein